jgi:hypothetical protein
MNQLTCKGGLLCPGYPWCDDCPPNPRAWALAWLKTQVKRLAWTGGLLLFVGAVTIKHVNDPARPIMSDAEFSASLERTRAHERAQKQRGAELLARAEAIRLDTEIMQETWAKVEATIKPGSQQARDFVAWAARLKADHEELLRDLDRAERDDPWIAAR